MSDVNITIAVVMACVLLVGLFSRRIKAGFFSEPILSLAVGVTVGPHLLGWLDLSEWGSRTAIIEQAARATLAVNLFAIALRVKPETMRRLWRPVTVLLTAGMIGMWAASSLLAVALLGLGAWAALLLGAAVTPTDPVVASSVVTGRFAENHLPLRIRATLSLESGANDGLTYLFLMLPVLMLQHGAGQAWQNWLTETLLVGVVLAVALGAAIGFGAAYILRWAGRRGMIESYSFLTFTIALSLFTLGATALVGADALLSVFMAGLVFNLCSDTEEEHEEENIQEAVGKLFTLPMFVVLGLSLPITEWLAEGWRLLAFAVALLLLRRLPVLLALFPLLHQQFRLRDVVYLGWFGPIGVAAVYYASLAEKKLHDPMYWNVVSAVVCASIVVHGITAAPGTRLHHRRAEGDGREAEAER